MDEYGFDSRTSWFVQITNLDISFVAREDTSPEKSMRSSSESGSTQAKKPTLIVLRIQGFDDISSANPLK